MREGSPELGPISLPGRTGVGNVPITASPPIWLAKTGGGQDPARIKDLIDFEAEEVPLEDALAPGWAFNMEDYLRHLRAGVPYLALRYDDLTADPRGSLERLFRHCGLPLEAVGVALAAFEQDSQAGTWNARNVRMDSLSEAQIAKLAGLLARDPSGLRPDLRLPDVYQEERQSQPERSHG